MQLRRPPCGNTDAHEAHGFFALPGPGGIPGEAWTECPGWSDEEAASLALAMRLTEVGGEQRATAALYCNPWVVYCLYGVLIPGYAEFISPRFVTMDEFVSSGLGIPVMRAPAMERGAWRLTIRDDRDTIAEGTIPLVLAGE